ncbi:MAG: NBR1-Ig-like domain-containing protein [Anaerolineales bacterium]
MKGRYYQILVYLLSGSLVVLVIMFVVRGLSNRNQSSRTDQAPTVVEAIDSTVVMTTSTSTESPLPIETETLEPTATILVATDNDVPDEGCNVAGFLADITIPDGKIIDPGSKFTKTWLLKNDGSCTWNTNYILYYYSGDKMSGPDSQQMVLISVPPGTTIEVSVDLIAPDQAGTYKGRWALKDPGGNHFGISSFKNPFYVEIIVEGSIAATDTPTP